MTPADYTICAFWTTVFLGALIWWAGMIIEALIKTWKDQ